jgi:hypothetical protein
MRLIIFGGKPPKVTSFSDWTPRTSPNPLSYDSLSLFDTDGLPIKYALLQTLTHARLYTSYGTFAASQDLGLVVEFEYRGYLFGAHTWRVRVDREAYSMPNGSYGYWTPRLNYVDANGTPYTPWIHDQTITAAPGQPLVSVYWVPPLDNEWANQSNKVSGKLRWTWLAE